MNSSFYAALLYRSRYKYEAILQKKKKDYTTKVLK